MVIGGILGSSLSKGSLTQGDSASQSEAYRLFVFVNAFSFAPQPEFLAIGECREKLS